MPKRLIRPLLALLAGMLVGVLVSTFIRPTCWGPILGVLLSCFLAKVDSLRHGALLGSITTVPIALYASLPSALQTLSQENLSPILNILALLLAALFAAGLGALYGVASAFLLQETRKRNWFV